MDMAEEQITRERTPFGQRMLDAREAVGLTQVEVRAILTVSQGTLSYLEREASGTKRLVEFAALYGVSPEWLATGMGERDPQGGQEQPRKASDITAEERQLLEAFRDLLPEEKADFAKPILDRAELARKHAEMAFRRRGISGNVVGLASRQAEETGSQPAQFVESPLTPVKGAKTLSDVSPTAKTQPQKGKKHGSRPHR